jgi:hypothetical protein
MLQTPFSSSYHCKVCVGIQCNEIADTMDKSGFRIFYIEVYNKAKKEIKKNRIIPFQHDWYTSLVPGGLTTCIGQTVVDYSCKT